MDWKESFSRPDLRLARAILAAHALRHLGREGNIYFAEVDMPDGVYYPHAQIENGDIVWAECTCEESQEKLCAHEAALLLELEQLPDLNDVPERPLPFAEQLAKKPREEIEEVKTPEETVIVEPEEKEPAPEPIEALEVPAPAKPEKSAAEESGSELEKLIAAVSEAELRRFVLQTAQDNPEFQDLLELKFSERIPGYYIEKAENQAEDLIEQVSDPYGMIEPHHLEQLTKELRRWLNRHVHPLLANGHAKEAFELTSWLIDRLLSLESEDFTPDDTRFGDELAFYIGEALHQADPILKDEMFEWVDENRHAEMIYDVADKLEELWLNGFQEEKYLLQKLSWVNEELKDERLRTVPGWRYYYEELLRDKYRILSSLPKWQNQLNEFEAAFANEPFFVKMQLEKAEREGDLPRKKALLEKSLRTSEGHEETYGMSRMLLDVYKELGDAEDEEALLKDLLFEQNRLYEEFYLRLKELQDPEEWAHTMARLEESMEPYQRKDLYAAEGRLDDLLAILKKDLTAFDLEKYGRQLADTHKADLAGLWIQLADEDVAKPGKRTAYQHAVQYLKRARELDENSSAVSEKVTEWRQKYGRRQALMEELNKAGL